MRLAQAFKLSGSVHKYGVGHTPHPYFDDAFVVEFRCDDEGVIEAVEADELKLEGAHIQGAWSYSDGYWITVVVGEGWAPCPIKRMDEILKFGRTR